MKKQLTKSIVNKIILSLFIIVILFSTVGCGNENVENEKIVRLESRGNDGLPNPFRHTSRGPAHSKAKLVYGSLLESDADGLINFLAESYEVSGNEYTFKLKDDLYFHDGEKIESTDILFSAEYYKQFPPVSNNLGSGDKHIVKNVVIIDEKTIKITTHETDANTLKNLGSMKILPEHIWENVEDPYSFDGEGKIVGSGPFELSEYNPTLEIYEFTAFDLFPLKQSCDKIQFVQVSDPILAFEREEIDIITLPVDLYESYLSNPDILSIDKSNDYGVKMLVNFEILPDFLDKEMREGLYYGIDRNKIVESVYRGAGDIGSAGYVPQGSVYYNDDVIKYEYDFEKAQEIFQGKEYEITILTSNNTDNNSEDIQIAELVKIDLEKLGFDITVKAVDFSTRDSLIGSGDYEMAIVGNGGWGGKAPEYLSTIFADDLKNKGGNPHNMGPIGYANEKITELCHLQMAETDMKKRIEIFHELQYEISKEIPIIVLATKSTKVIYKNGSHETWTKTYNYQQVEQNVMSYMEKI